MVLYDAYRIRLCETWLAMSLNIKKIDSVRQMNRVNTYWNRWSTKWNEHAEYNIKRLSTLKWKCSESFSIAPKISFRSIWEKNSTKNWMRMILRWNEMKWIRQEREINEKIIMNWLGRQYAEPIWIFLQKNKTNVAKSVECDAYWSMYWRS